MQTKQDSKTDAEQQGKRTEGTDIHNEEYQASILTNPSPPSFQSSRTLLSTSTSMASMPSAPRLPCAIRLPIRPRPFGPLDPRISSWITTAFNDGSHTAELWKNLRGWCPK